MDKFLILTPAVQITAIIAFMVCFAVFWISFTDSWGSIFRKKR